MGNPAPPPVQSVPPALVQDRDKWGWLELCWPVGGTLLGLIVVPMAIEQWPEWFKENPWLLPVSALAALACFLVPLLLHNRARRFYAGASGRFGRRLAIPLVSVLTLLLVLGFWFSGRWMIGKNRSHLAMRMARSAPQPQTIAPETVVPSIDGLRREMETNQHKTELLIGEITELLKQRGDVVSQKKLLAKYPLGYAIFDVDSENHFVPYKSKLLLDQYDFDWSVVRISKNTATEIALRLPDVKRKDGTLSFTNAVTGGAKRVGDLGGVIFGRKQDPVGVYMWGEILAIRRNGIVFLVGFESTPTPHFPPPR